jgi:hypothetical protein
LGGSSVLSKGSAVTQKGSLQSCPLSSCCCGLVLSRNAHGPASWVATSPQESIATCPQGPYGKLGRIKALRCPKSCAVNSWCCGLVVARDLHGPASWAATFPRQHARKSQFQLRANQSPSVLINARGCEHCPFQGLRCHAEGFLPIWPSWLLLLRAGSLKECARPIASCSQGARGKLGQIKALPC